MSGIEIREKIQDALVSKRTIEIVYERPEWEDSTAETTKRHVDIYAINDEYLAGYCHLREDKRTFRIDRIKEVKITNETFGVSSQLLHTIKNDEYLNSAEFVKVSGQSSKSAKPLVKEQDRINNDTDLVNEFKEALDKEIEHIKKMGGGTKLVVKNGQFLERKGESFIYQFTLRSPTDIPEDSPINIRIKSQTSKGSIIAIEGLKMLVALDEDIGQSVVEAIISTNPYFLLEKLQEKLQGITDGELSINTELSKKVFGLRKANIRDEKGVEFDPTQKLNEEQKRVVERALGSEVSFVWGPPGTGKTHTLAAIAKKLFEKGWNVLILSNTNIAIDNAITKISELSSGNQDYLDGKVLRYGHPQIRNLFKKIKEIDVDYWVEVKGQALRKKKNFLERDLRNLNDKIIRRQKLLTAIKALNNKKAKEQKLEVELGDVKKARKKVCAAKKERKENLDAIEREILEIEKASAVKRMFLSLRMGKLQAKKEHLSTILDNLETQFEESEEPIKTAEKAFDSARWELAEAKDGLLAVAKQGVIFVPCQDTKCKQILGIELEEKSAVLARCPRCKTKFNYSFNKSDIPKKNMLEENIGDLQYSANETGRQIKEINAELSEIKKRVLKEARLIATTLCKGYLDEVICKREFDAVIVDEVSMAPMPMLFFDCGLAKRKVIIFGDFRQLAPICQSTHPLTKKWMKRDIFAQNHITEEVSKRSQDRRLVRLVDQHRMHPSIVSLVNAPLYDGYLKNTPKVKKEAVIEAKTIASEPFSGESVVVVDTSSFNPWCSVTESWSRFNIYNARLCLDLAKQAIKNGINSIGIISPYAAQNRLMAKLVLDNRFEDNIDVSTIHRFQGREKELIIFDAVEGPGSSVSHLVDGGVDSDAARLLNVAITRARSKLIFVINAEYLLQQMSRGAIFRDILKILKDAYSFKCSSDFFEFVDRSKTRQQKGKITNEDKTYFYTQALFFREFYKDLDNCEEELVLFSPFMTKKRVGEIDSYLRELVEKKVNTVVVTRPIHEHRGALREEVKEVIDYFKQVGINVVFRENMHEKIAVIDGRIVWHGSLNMLSHHNTSELMMRLSGEETAEELLKMYRMTRISKEAKLRDKIKEIKYGSCPKCGSYMVVKLGPLGPFLSCSSSSCKGAMDLDNNIIEQIYGKDFLVCECGAPMRLRRGRGGKRFLGCSKYPDHKFSRFFT